MRRPRDPKKVLDSMFPWPKQRPTVDAAHASWFTPQKALLLERVVPRESRWVLELGSWLGDSTRWFCRHCPKAVVVAVDTWFGSSEHLLRKAEVLPSLYEAFLNRCWEHRHRLVPFRNTTLCAMQFLRGLGVLSDVVYFDADHSYWGLTADLETAHQSFPSAVLVGDDFSRAEVSIALARFVDNHPAFERVEVLHDTWCLVRKGWAAAAGLSLGPVRTSGENRGRD